MKKSKEFVFEKGVVSDFENGAQVGDFLSDLTDGVIMSFEGGTYILKNTKKNSSVTLTSMPNGFEIVGCEEFEGSILVMLKVSGASHIGKLSTTVTRGVLTYTSMIVDTDSSVFGFVAGRLLKRILINRENAETLGIYWNDGISAPKGIRYFDGITIGQIEGASFAYESGYLNTKFKQLIPGALPSGSYFYCARMLSKSGSVTDWSMVMGPVNTPERIPVNSITEYALLSAKLAGEITSVGIRLSIENIPTGFAKLEVATFYSKDSTSLESGYIFYRDDIGEDTTKLVDHTSAFVLDSIVLTQALTGSYTVLSCEDFAIIRNQMIIAGPSLLNDMPLTTKITRNKVLGDITNPLVLVSSVKYANFDDQGDDPALETGGLTVPPVNVAITGTNGEILVSRNKYTKTDTTNVTEDIIGYNDFRSHKGTTLSTLCKSAIRGETYRIGMVPVYKGKRQAVRWIGDLVMPECNASPITQKSYSGYTYIMNILLAKVSGIDFTDFVTVDGSGNAVSCTIDGFHIVVAPREGSWLNEGFILPVVYHRDQNNNDLDQYGLIYAPSAGYRTHVGNKDDEHPIRIPNLYQYYTPDRTVETQIRKTPTKLRIESQYEGVVNATKKVASGSYSSFKGGTDSTWDNYWMLAYNGLSIYQKYYKPTTESGTDIRSFNDLINVRSLYELKTFNPLSENQAQGIFISEAGNRKFLNMYRAYWRGSGSLNDWDAIGYGVACDLIVTENTDTYSFASYLHNTLTVVSNRSGALSNYGGPSDAALARTKYRSCWHYQEITPAILNEIKTSEGKFIFNNVEAFIGDVHIIPFSINRVFRGRFIQADNEFNQTQSYPSSHAEVVPIQSEINNSLSLPDKWLKERSLTGYSNTSNLSDIAYYTGIGAWFKQDDPLEYIKMENLKTPAFLKSISIGNNYLALSPDINYSEKHPCRILWTDKKIPGEEYDTFMNYPIANYLDLPGNFILISGIMVDREKIIAFCERGLASLPVDERMLMPGQKEVQISSQSGISRYDIISMLATLKREDFFSLKSTPYGFMWFDRDNLDWFLFPGNETPISIPTITFARKYFEDLFKLSNHVAYSGNYSNIKCWYDAGFRELFISGIFTGNIAMALACNIEKKVFQGKRVSYAKNFQLTVKDILYFANASTMAFQDDYTYSDNDIIAEIVFNLDSQDIKEFTNLSLNGVTHAPDQLIYNTDLVINSSQTPINLVTSFFNQLGFDLIMKSGNVRSISINRITGRYLRVKIYFNSISSNQLFSLRNLQITYKDERF
jgi:hypothetical protein